MADIRCPMCSKPNAEELDVCQFCGAQLKPIIAPTQDGSPSIRPGEQPVKKNTAEFEKVNLPPADKEPIHPGEAPTKKNTAELERALPSWLRALREGQDKPTSGSVPEPAADQSPPPGPGQVAAPEPSSSGMPDWLAGLGAIAASEEEKVPDWLTSLREKSSPESLPTPEPEPQPAPGKNLPTESFPPSGQESLPPSEASIAEWFTGRKAETPPAAPEPPIAVQPPAPLQPEPAPETGLPDWVLKLQGGSATPEEKQPAGPPREEKTPDWLSNLPATPPEPQAAPFQTTPAEELPDWLNKLNGLGTSPETAQPSAAPQEPVPDWLKQVEPEAGTPEAAPAENIPDWLSKLETKAGPGAGEPSAPARRDEAPAAPGQQPLETPDWLSKLQSDITAPSETDAGKEEFETASEPLPQPAPSSLPSWLSGIEPTPAASDATPALILEPEEQGPDEAGEAAFAMETPDWLSKLSPEQGTQEAPAGEEGQGSKSIQPAELPSWVQAMRPVESVIAATKATPQDEGKVAEERGPLAGLRGVLPAGPGLGPLRKPPAYSVKLQATESQQRYAGYLEKLITEEDAPRAIKARRPISTRLLRWIIAALLILAAVLPIVTGIQIAPSSALYPPEMVATFNLISGLPANAPVLIAFDYEPALSGELEAAAAPVIDHLLFGGARLTFVSTSPTGPALAERFLLGTQADHNYQAGQQYVNLGYLAGGPAGVFYFATQPTRAAAFTVDGTPAWQTPPLQGVQKLSDFSAVLVLTDSADTARVWIEQAGSYLGNTPMAMVISAQAEPMVRPYYDSSQIKGLVTGLAGGKAYEQAIQHPGLGQTYWNAFSAGLLVAEMLILVGCVWSAIAGWVTRRSKPGGKA